MTSGLWLLKTIFFIIKNMTVYLYIPYSVFYSLQAAEKARFTCYN